MLREQHGKLSGKGIIKYKAYIVIDLSEHLGFKSDAYVGEPLLKLFSKSGWPTSRIASEISNLIESQQ